MPGPPSSVQRCRDFSYRLHPQTGTHQATVEFEGVFEHRPVRWLATIVSLTDGHADAASEHERPFIEIDTKGANADGVVAVRVGLRVAQIDLPTICKTIIMLRQYKRLRRGRMEFG